MKQLMIVSFALLCSVPMFGMQRLSTSMNRGKPHFSKVGHPQLPLMRGKMFRQLCSQTLQEQDKPINKEQDKEVNIYVNHQIGFLKTLLIIWCTTYLGDKYYTTNIRKAKIAKGIDEGRYW